MLDACWGASTVLCTCIYIRRRTTIENLSVTVRKKNYKKKGESFLLCRIFSSPVERLSATLSPLLHHETSRAWFCAGGIHKKRRPVWIGRATGFAGYSAGPPLLLLIHTVRLLRSFFLCPKNPPPFSRFLFFEMSMRRFSCWLFAVVNNSENRGGLNTKCLYFCCAGCRDPRL